MHEKGNWDWSQKYYGGKWTGNPKEKRGRVHMQDLNGFFFKNTSGFRNDMRAPCSSRLGTSNITRSLPVFLHILTNRNRLHSWAQSV